MNTAGELQNIFVPVVLNDTPGTNSSNNAEHMRVTQDFLTSNTPALIIFVINAENIGADEKSLAYSIRFRASDRTLEDKDVTI